MENTHPEKSPRKIAVFTPEFIDHALKEFQAHLVRDELCRSEEIMTLRAIRILSGEEVLTDDSEFKVLFALDWIETNTLDLDGNLREHQKPLVERFQACGSCEDSALEDGMSLLQVRSAKRWVELVEANREEEVDLDLNCEDCAEPVALEDSHGEGDAWLCGDCYGERREAQRKRERSQAAWDLACYTVRTRSADSEFVAYCVDFLGAYVAPCKESPMGRLLEWTRWDDCVGPVRMVEGLGGAA